MIRNWISKITVGLGLSASLFLGLACGGKEKVDEAIVEPSEPNVAAKNTGAAPAAANTNAAPSTAKGTADSSAATAAPVKAEGWGTLKGHVVFGGDPPELKPLVTKDSPLAKDPEVCLVKPIPNQRLVVDKETKGVKYALVYIPKPTAVNPEVAAAASKATVEFDQKQCVFEPHVLAVMKGAKIEVKSSDAKSHNVNSRLQNTKFNSSIAPNTMMPIQTKSADKSPGPIVCDIHPWMKAWWLVSDSPYFAVTDEKGNFEIKNVPAGTQKVVVWQEAVGGPITASAGDPVDVKAGGETVKDFTIDPGKVKPEG